MNTELLNLVLAFALMGTPTYSQDLQPADIMAQRYEIADEVMNNMSNMVSQPNSLDALAYSELSFDETYDAVDDLDSELLFIDNNDSLSFENTNVTINNSGKQCTVNNFKASTISVSCLKVEWECSDENQTFLLEVNTEASFRENITFVWKKDNLCYLTGLRENSEYALTLVPIIDGVEDYNYAQTIYAHTEAVNRIQTYQHEDGWTNCFAGERASGLTRMPSSGAIYGSICDPITGTGIRRNDYGDYCCAMGLWYGGVGDRFLIELENGIQFTVEICDSKGWGDDANFDGDADGRFHWFGGAGRGKCIVEFIYNDSSLPTCVAFSGSWGYWNWNGLDLGANIANVTMIDYGSPITY